MINLEYELKQLIIEVLNLEDISAEDIDSHSPLFGAGLGLDSIDALELGIAIKKKYHIMIESDAADTKKHFESVASLAKFITQGKKDNE